MVKFVVSVPSNDRVVESIVNPVVALIPMLAEELSVKAPPSEATATTEPPNVNELSESIVIAPTVSIP